MRRVFGAASRMIAEYRSVERKVCGLSACHVLG
jgi:hypothetical protein